MKIMLILFIIFISIYTIRLILGAIGILANKTYNTTSKVINTLSFVVELPTLIYGIYYILTLLL